MGYIPCQLPPSRDHLHSLEPQPAAHYEVENDYLCVPRQATSVPKTNSSPIKDGSWKTTFILGWPIFGDYASFREGKSSQFFGDIFLIAVTGFAS